MYSVDDTVKALALAPARHIYSHAIFGTKSGTTWDNDRTYTDTDSLISAKIDIGSNSGGLTIGAAYSAKLTLKLMGDVTVNQTDRIIMRVGFYNSDGTKSDKIGLGWFYVDTITRKDKLTTVVAYDKMLRGAKIYKPTALTFPCRASAILDDICDKMGVSLRDGVAMPYDPIINEAPTKGKDSDGNTLYYTRREILGYLASIMGGNWFFDAGGHLAFTQFEAVSDTFAAANSTAADISSDAYAVTGITWNINGVPYSRFDDEDAAGMLEFSNPLKVDAKEPIMGAVEQRLVGLTYHSGTIQRQGCGWFELGDIVTAYRKDGTSSPVLITGINYSIEGGAFTEKIFSSALSNSESNYTSGDISGQTVPQSVAQEEAANASGNSSALTEYEYLTDLSAKCNGVTYTAETDETTGLISKISDSNGNEFEPTINSGISDTALHNAVFWAVAMTMGFGGSSAPKPVIELLFNNSLENTGSGSYTIAPETDSAEILYSDGLNGKCYSATNKSGITITDVSELLLSDFTITFWTKINKNGLSPYPKWRRFVWWNADKEYKAYNGLEVNYSGSTSTNVPVFVGGTVAVDASTPIADGAWHSISIVKRGDKIVITIDLAEQIVRTNYTLSSVANYLDLSKTDYSLNGYISSFRVFNKALSYAEIERVLALK